MVHVFKNIGQRSVSKTYHPVSLLSVVSKVFEKLVNNRIVDHLEKCGPISYFQYGFRSSRSTLDLVTVESDKIARVFNRFWATLTVALDIFKAFDSGNISQVRYYSLPLLFSVIDSFKWFWMASPRKNI